MQGQSSKLAAERMEKLMLGLERDIEEDIVRRIIKAGKITGTAEWQIGRTRMLGSTPQEVQALISSRCGMAAEETQKMLLDAARSDYVRDEYMFRARKIQQVPYENNLELRQLVRSIYDQTAGEIRNISGSTGFMIKGQDGLLRFTPMSEMYTGYIDRSLIGVASGAFSYEEMIRKATLELTSSGLRTVDYASGRSNRVDVAVRRAILTGYGQIASNVSFSNAAALGTDEFEVSWHPNARPDHQKWQGQVWSRKQLETVCGYGTVHGLCGSNCRHVFYPWIEGVSKRSMSYAELDRLDAQENAKRPFDGKEYTSYEATQEQRQLETAMRAYDERANLLSMDDALHDDAVIARAKYQALRRQYSRMSKAFGLPEQMWRVNAA